MKNKREVSKKRSRRSLCKRSKRSQKLDSLSRLRLKRPKPSLLLLNKLKQNHNQLPSSQNHKMPLLLKRMLGRRRLSQRLHQKPYLQMLSKSDRKRPLNSKSQIKMKQNRLKKKVLKRMQLQRLMSVRHGMSADLLICILLRKIGRLPG